MMIHRLSLLTIVAVAACQAEPEDQLTTYTDAQYASTLEGLHAGSFPLIPQSSSLVRAIYALESKRWIRWIYELPTSTGPLLDETGASCGQGQSGLVWYLAGTFGGAVTRDCTIPKNRFLFLPLINHWILPPEDLVDEPEELAGYLEYVAEYFPYQRAHTCNLKLELDGAPLLATQEELDAKLWTQVLTPFEAELNDDNFAGLPGGTYTANTEGGHYALLFPFAPGSTHALEFGGALCDDDGAVLFETSALYNLTVSH